MGKALLLLKVFLLLAIAAIANPVPSEFFLSELYVKSDSSWKMDLFVYHYDDIYIITSKDTLCLKNVYLSKSVSSDTLTKLVKINPKGDKVVFKYSLSSFTLDSICFGNDPGASLPALTDTTSFKKEEGMNFFCISNKPQIGVLDIDNTTFQLQGTIHKKNGSLMDDGSFTLTQGDIVSYGYMYGKSYNASVYYFSKQDSIRTIYLLKYKQTVSVKPFVLNAYIGDSIQQDLYILDELDQVHATKNVTIIGKIYDQVDNLVQYDWNYCYYSFNSSFDYDGSCPMLNDVFTIKGDGSNVYSYTFTINDSSKTFSSIFNWGKCIVTHYSILPMHFKFMNDTTINADIHLNGLLKTNDVQETLFSLFPNPASTTITLVYHSGEASTNAEIYSLSGVKVDQLALSSSGNKKLFDVSKYEKGIYIIRVLANGKIIGEQQFVVIK